MAISAAALHEGLAVCLVLESGIGLASLAILGDPVPFEVAQVSVHGPAHRRAHLWTPCATPLRIEPDDPGLDDDPPRSKPRYGISLPASLPTPPSKRGQDLRTPAA